MVGKEVYYHLGRAPTWEPEYELDGELIDEYLLKDVQSVGGLDGGKSKKRCGRPRKQ
jgi:hypothetical protein